jgi:hypothetical protein
MCRPAARFRALHHAGRDFVLPVVRSPRVSRPPPAGLEARRTPAPPLPPALRDDERTESVTPGGVALSAAMAAQPE